MGAVAVTEQAIINEAHERGMVVPNRKQRLTDDDTQAAGAYVAYPKKGLHMWIGSVDINSLYPSAIRAMNMGPETVVGQLRQTMTDHLIKANMAKGQSFGRYTGENVFNEMNHFTFLLENMLWSFLPWIFIFLTALVLSVYDLVKVRCKLQGTQEFIAAGGFIATYCMLARSQAQLPHYIFVVLPLAAVVTAKGLHQIYYSESFLKLQKVLLYFHGFIFSILWTAVMGIVFLVFTDMPVYVKVFAVVGASYFWYVLFFKQTPAPKFISLALYTILGVNFILNTSFYPRLLKYELGVSAAAFINQNKLPKTSIYLYEIDESRALHFYGNHSFERIFDSSLLTPGQILITKASSFPKLQQQFPGSSILHKNAYFGVSMLTLPFLNPATRDKEVTPYIIVTLAK